MYGCIWVCVLETACLCVCMCVYVSRLPQFDWVQQSGVKIEVKAAFQAALNLQSFKCLHAHTVTPRHTKTHTHTHREEHTDTHSERDVN